MSDSLWGEVRERLEDHAYMGGIRRSQDRVDASAEVFTPSDLVIRMVRRFPVDYLAPGKTVLDPACGDGQFLVAIKWVKVLRFGLDEEEALKDLYGIDIMRDNVDLCRQRLGGGTIVMGDTLAPERRLEGQTEEERMVLKSIFGLDQQLTLHEIGISQES